MISREIVNLTKSKVESTSPDSIIDNPIKSSPDAFASGLKLKPAGHRILSQPLDLPRISETGASSVDPRNSEVTSGALTKSILGSRESMIPSSNSTNLGVQGSNAEEGNLVVLIEKTSKDSPQLESGKITIESTVSTTASTKELKSGLAGGLQIILQKTRKEII